MTINYHMPVHTFLIPAAIIMCIIVYACIYLHGIQRGNVRPILATWVLFILATVMSFVTNLADSGIQGIHTNLFNIVDMIAVLIILSVVLRKKNIRRTFTAFEKGCIGASLCIGLAWLISGQNVVAHLSIQIILVIAYVPTLLHLWTAQQNTESLSMWFFDCLASVFGLIEPIRSSAFLPIVYGVRAVICTFLVCLLILRLRYRQNNGTDMPYKEVHDAEHLKSILRL